MFTISSKELCFLFLLTAVSLFSRPVIALAHDSFNEACLLYKAEEIQNAAPQNADSEKRLIVIDSYVIRRLLAPNLRYWERIYLEGHKAWREGNIGEARNAWYKLMAIPHERENAVLTRRREEVKAFYLKTAPPKVEEAFESRIEESEESRKPPSSRIRTEAKVTVEMPAPVRRRRPSAVSVTEVEKKAMQAKESGQYERALQLYELALKLQPDSVSVHRELSLLREEMNGRR